MSTADTGRARVVAHKLIAACSVAGDAAEVPLSGAFRCWTPFADWQRAEAGMEALRGVTADFCTLAGVAGRFRPDVIITDGEIVVLEAAIAAEPGHPAVTMTLLVALNDGLVEEVRCYVDPRAFETLRWPDGRSRDSTKPPLG